MGNALCAVDPAGRLVLPGFVRATLSRRGDPRLIFVGGHGEDPCLVAYDRSHAARLASDCRRLFDAEDATERHAHAARSRRLFGFVEQVLLDSRGKLALPPMMRRRARIEGLALVVGTGGPFEIWNPKTALEGGDPALSELAAFHLDCAQAA
jgi:MraZ protein